MSGSKYLLAAACLGISIFIHILSLLGIDVRQYSSGILLISIPAIYFGFQGAFMVRSVYYDPGLSEVQNLKPYFRFMAKPAFNLRYLSFLLFLYVFVNIFIGILGAEGAFMEQDGKYFIEKDGDLIRHITEGEYHKGLAQINSTFSSLWMFCFSMPVAMYNRYKVMQVK